MVNNGLILVGVPAFWQQVVKGAILLSRCSMTNCAGTAWRKHEREDRRHRLRLVGNPRPPSGPRANPDAVIAGIADPDAVNRTRAAERFGIGPDRVFANAAEMLDQAGLDGAIVAVPHSAHATWPARCSIAVSISSSRNR